MEALLTPLLQVLGSALAAALVALVIKLMKKAGVEVDATKQMMLERTVQMGVSYADEKAKNYLKENGAKLDSKIKEKLALDYVIAKLPNVDQEEAVRIMQASLPMIRAGLAAGIGELGKALATKEAPPQPPATPGV